MLSVDHLSVDLHVGGLRKQLVRSVSFSVRGGDVVAIVGDSGAGKSICCRAISGLLPPEFHVGGRVCIDGNDVVGKSEREWRRYRGRLVSVVFQDSLAALNPNMTVGAHLEEVIRLRFQINRRDARKRSRELFEQFGISDAQRWVRSYPHELSGGMQQLASLVIALSSRPAYLLLDEFARSVDPVTRQQIMRILREYVSATEAGIILVSHDLAFIRTFSDSIVIVEDGAVVERQRTSDFFASAQAECGKRLVSAYRALEGAGLPVRRRKAIPTATIHPEVSPLLELRCVSHGFRANGKTRSKVVADVSFRLNTSETLGIVGESGSGKSTLARCLVQLPRPMAGQILLQDRDLASLSLGELRTIRREIQLVQQDSFASMDPLWSVRKVIEEPLVNCGRSGRRELDVVVNTILEEVGLPFQEFAGKNVRRLSGGQLQRVALARALVLRPRVLILDETFASLDVVSQRALINVIESHKRGRGMACILISHDLASIRRASDRIAVMYRGHVCEIGPSHEILSVPAHPYTAQLVSCDVANETHYVNEVSSRKPGNVSGCSYCQRCDLVTDVCRHLGPQVRSVSAYHQVMCHNPRADVYRGASADHGI